MHNRDFVGEASLIMSAFELFVIHQMRYGHHLFTPHVHYIYIYVNLLLIVGKEGLKNKTFMGQCLVMPITVEHVVPV